ncbi:UDP-N-acetylglucosamine transferase subunit ALG13 homolog isoform X1 [Tachysurus vachellii]|uniref:UDP-N-acetylglucosamine transferase subunit ALG13 homolog isoform X1 n=1 Tax=Tachysurus vachellii TaxID=175792 RepID=UPI00296AAE8D|nr:UDP-N-acetylglucosamine transferase subunit ALG13 homolog isoform X1 [Tachysurus vachellii]
MFGQSDDFYGNCDRPRSVNNHIFGTMKTVFVTVGTTCFDDLIVSLTSDETVEALIQRGYTDVVLQVGRGSYIPDAHSCPGLRLEVFCFKESIAENIQSADLVISHAGAGSCLEVLGAGKPLLVVINDKLMDNHQLELAKQLQADGHLLYCTCSTLAETLRNMDLSTLLPFQRGQPENFAQFLDKAVGFV